jgi:drug/metabolite transporter (DMT)-like permease
MINFIALLWVFLGTIFSSLGSLFFKKGSSKFNFNILSQIRNIPLILGFLFYFFGAFLYIVGLSMEKLSVLFPLTALAYIWVLVLSIFFLKEKVTFRRWLGVFFIFSGIFLITFFS